MTRLGRVAPDLLWSDGYHPSDAGYARWAELLWEGVEARITAPRY